MSSSSPSALAARLDVALSRLAARGDIPHVVMAVERGDGSFRWAGAAGPSAPGGEPMTVDTPYFIASIDKLMNAVVALRLVEQGRLRLDEPAATYLPDVFARGVHTWRGTDWSSAITVRHLLTHTSGLAEWLEDRPAGGRSLVERLVAEGDIVMNLEDSVAYVRDRLRPHFPPQPPESDRVRYSDTNFLLLVAVIERVAGRPLHEVHDTLLYRPIGMRATWMAGQARPGASAPAALWFGAAPVEIPGMMASIRGIYSTVGDQLRFLRALTRGEVFDNPETFAKMQGRWRRFGVPRDAASLRSPNWPIEYGQGVMRFRLPRWLTPLRAMPALVGHTGSTGSWLFQCADLDVLLAGTVDQGTAGAVPYRFLPGVLRTIADTIGTG